MGAGTPFPLPLFPLHPCWMPLPSAGEGEAAGSLAEFSPCCEHGQHPWKQRRFPPAASPLLWTFLRCPSSGNWGSLGSSPVAINTLRASLLSPPSAARFGAGSGITCREECGSHTRNELLGWDLLPGPSQPWGHQTRVGSTDSFSKIPLFLRLPGIRGSPGQGSSLQQLSGIIAHPS